MSAIASVNPDGTGWAMMAMANQDPWHNKTTRGFKGALTQDQGPDVYRHLFAYSGAATAVNSGGLLAAGWEMSKDALQVLQSKHGARNELLDDLAGLAIGAAMKAGGPFTGWVTRQVSRIVCK